MQRHPGTSRNTLAVGGAARRRIVPRMLTGLIGVGLVLYLIFSAGVDPWHWWEAYQSRTDKPSMRHDESANSPGLVSAVQPEPVGTDSSVAVSQTPLFLKATRPGRNAREGHAELGVNPASPQTYRAGAILANGARLDEIYSDHVVLARDGQRVRLYVDGHAPTNSLTSDSALLAVGGANSTVAAHPNSKDELTDHIRVSPVFEGDFVRALEVYSTERSNIFKTLGLEPGDRITSIDGEAIADSAAAIASLRRLTQGAALQVTLERAGHTQTLSLNGLILTAAQQPAAQ